MDWDKLVAERNEWVAHNFPNKGPEYPNGVSFHTVFGVFEEAGELAHAHLKQAQSIRGSDEEHVENAQDAIGDCTIYLLGVMAEVGVPVSVPVMTINDLDKSLQYLGRECGSLLLNPSLYNVELVAYHLRKYATLRGWDYEQIVLDTWAKVSKRDWIADPVAGGESA